MNTPNTTTPPNNPYTFYKDPVGATNLVAPKHSIYNHVEKCRGDRRSVSPVSVYATYATNLVARQKISVPLRLCGKTKTQQYRALQPFRHPKLPEILGTMRGLPEELPGALRRAYPPQYSRRFTASGCGKMTGVNQ